MILKRFALFTVMDFQNVFINLTPEEFRKVESWLSRLREPERDRVRDTLNVLNNHDYVPTAVIAAGSSIDTEAYPDIDLFLLIKEPFSPYKQGQARPNPKEEFSPA